MLTKIDIVTITAAIGAIAVLSAVVWFWRRRVRHQVMAENASDRKQEAKHLSVVDTTSPESHPYTETPNSFDKETLNEIASKIQDSNIRDYVLEIANAVSEAGPVFDSETPLSFIEEMVDRADDLAAMAPKQDEQSKDALFSFKKSLVGILAACGAELIHSTSWDPAIQKAIAKEPTEGIESPTILRFGSTGIRRHSELLRKQEVVLAVPL